MAYLEQFSAGCKARGHSRPRQLAGKYTVKADSGGNDDGDDESPKDQFFRIHAHHLGLCIITGNCRKGRTARHHRPDHKATTDLRYRYGAGHAGIGFA